MLDNDICARNNLGTYPVPKAFLNYNISGKEKTAKMAAEAAVEAAKKESPKKESPKNETVKKVAVKKEAVEKVAQSAAPKEAKAVIVSGQVTPAESDDAVSVEATVQLLAGLATVAAPHRPAGLRLWALMVHDDHSASGDHGCALVTMITVITMVIM